MPRSDNLDTIIVRAPGVGRAASGGPTRVAPRFIVRRNIAWTVTVTANRRHKPETPPPAPGRHAYNNKRALPSPGN